MKASILYYSKSGNTAEMAQVIADGMTSVPGVEARICSIEAPDESYLRESQIVVVGTPTYHANPCWQIKKWLDESARYHLEGKLGGAFATANFAQGGADLAISTVLTHLMVDGMLVYSGGSALGLPFIHLGPVALRENWEASRELFRVFGQRMAEKGVELFGTEERPA